MKKIYLYGNWKMNMTCGETTDFFVKLISVIKEDELIAEAINKELEIAVFPPFTSIVTARLQAARLHDIWRTRGITVNIGAQNVYYEKSGAYTGEVSISMLKELDCSRVLIGHSERRAIFKESNELLAKKLKAVLDSGIIPVFCYGETLEEREGGKTYEILTEQLTAGLEKLTKEEIEKIIFAYEPVWAIGTGKSATSQEAEEACEFSRTLISKISGADGKRLVILYGGSVKPDNAKELLSMPNIDGALVGGASLKVESFLDIFRAYKN